MRFVIATSLAVLSLAQAAPSPQSSDLDRLMERVLVRRDENWTRLQQYILSERESFDLTGPGGVRLYGFRRDYTWFQREGYFIRSPLRVDSVTLTESERQKAEADWLSREKRREKNRQERAADDESTASSTSAAPASPFEPAFVSSAYFLKFPFEPNRYALVGREQLDGRAVLKIEYYPSAMFDEGRTRPHRKARDRDEAIEAKMNKVSMVTLWIEPERHQILQYTFDDIDMDFLPGRSLVRVDDVKATMRMGQPFPDVWLPRDIEMRFRMTLAMGSVDAHYRVEYHDYRQADVTYKIR